MSKGTQVEQVRKDIMPYGFQKDMALDKAIWLKRLSVADSHSI